MEVRPLGSSPWANNIWNFEYFECSIFKNKKMTTHFKLWQSKGQVKHLIACFLTFALYFLLGLIFSQKCPNTKYLKLVFVNSDFSSIHATVVSLSIISFVPPSSLSLFPLQSTPSLHSLTRSLSLSNFLYLSLKWLFMCALSRGVYSLIWCISFSL